MEEFLLRRLFSGNELDIVHQQYVRRAVFLAEGLIGMRADGSDHVVGKFFGGHIENIQAARLAGIPDGMQKVGLPQPYSPVQEQRIIGTRWLLGNSQASG